MSRCYCVVDYTLLVVSVYKACCLRVCIYCFRLAAAQEAAAQAVQQQAGAAGAADRMGGASAAGGQGPSSLFLFSEENPIRRYTRFIIEWPYPFLLLLLLLFLSYIRKITLLKLVVVLLSKNFEKCNCYYYIQVKKKDKQKFALYIK